MVLSEIGFNESAGLALTMKIEYGESAIFGDEIIQFLIVGDIFSL